MIFQYDDVIKSSQPSLNNLKSGFNFSSYKFILIYVISKESNGSIADYVATKFMSIEQIKGIIPSRSIAPNLIINMIEKYGNYGNSDFIKFRYLNENSFEKISGNGDLTIFQIIGIK